MVRIAIACLLAMAAPAAAQPGVAPETPQPRASEPAWPSVTVRLGDGHFEADSEDVTREGYIPSAEVAVATPLGSVHASVTRFSDRVNDAGDDTIDNMSFTVISTGVRHRWRVMRHVTVAAGPGIVIDYQRNHSEATSRTTGGLLFDAIASIELVRSGPVSLEVFDRIQLAIGGLGVITGSSLFGLGVSYTR